VLMASGDSAQGSLLRKIIWRLSVITGVVFVIVLAVLTFQFYSTVDTLRDRSLVSQANDVANHLDMDSAGVPGLRLPDVLAQSYARLGGEFSYVVMNADGEVLFSLDGDKKRLSPFGLSQSSMEISYFRLPASAGKKLERFGATVPVRRHGRLFWIQVMQGEPHDDIMLDTIVGESFTSSGWMVMLLFSALLLINIVTIRNGLKPLKTASRQALAIGPSATDIRLPERDIPAEILPLVRAVNSALGRLESGFKMQRKFTADAAHQLRTPLAILTARIGKLKDPDEAALLKADIRMMNRIVSQLLKVAQLEALTIRADERADLSAVCVEVVSYLGAYAIDQRKSISLVGAEEPVIVSGNAETLSQAIGNLVENALNYTPVGTVVEIRVGDDGKVTVRDHGGGIPPEQRELVFRRFWRANSDVDGAGLGLAIVSGIVRAHGGKIAIDDADPDDQGRRGAVFTMKLPLPGGGVARPSGF